MPKLTWVLKRPKETTTTLILFYTCNDGRLRYYTGLSVKTSEWVAGKPTNKGIIAQIQRMTVAIDALQTNANIADIRLTKDLVKKELDRVRNRVSNKPSEAGNLFPKMREVIKRMQKGELLTPGSQSRYSAGSIKTYNFTVNLLQKFDPSLSVMSVSMVTYEKFVTWCQDKGYSNNYIGSQVKNWLRLGRLIGGNPVYEKEGFKKIREETDNIFLDETELTLLFNLELTGRKLVARDWFILDCYTGLRVSDLTLLGSKNLGAKAITISNKKTGAKVVIPVHPFVKKIVERHRGFPPKVTDVELNRMIKVICKEAGMDSTYLHTITKGGKRTSEYFEKWQKVTCHTARRSFVTNLRKNGMPDSVVMKIAGIKSLATLQKYDKLTVDQAALIAQRHDFFN